MRRAGFAIVLVFAVLPRPAGSATIELSNFDMHAGALALVRRPGASFLEWAFYDQEITTGPDASASSALSYAEASASATVLRLEMYSSVDARGIEALGYDRVSAEASGWFKADLVVTGGNGPVDLRITTRYAEEWMITGEGAIHAEVAVAIGEWLGPETTRLIFDGGRVDRTAVLPLQYGTRYEIAMVTSAYSRAFAGHQTWNHNTYRVDLAVVPEAAPAGLVLSFLFGLGVVRGRARGLERRGLPDEVKELLR